MSDVVEFPNWMWGTPDNEPYWRELKAEFESRHPGVTLTDEVIPGGEYQDKMFTLMSAGNAPDLVTPFDPAMRAWADADLLEPLDPWLEEAGYDIDSFIPANRMAVGDDGKVYGVIMMSNPRVLFVNRGLLESEGLDVPTTPDDVLALSEALRDSSSQTFGFATMSASAAAFPTFGELMPIVKSFGGDFFRDGEPTANDPATVEALDFIKRLHDENLIPTGQTELIYREAFSQGKVGSIVVGAFIMAIIQSKNPDAFDDYDTVPMPFGSARTTAANGFIAIPKGAKNKEAAAQVILTMLEDEWQQKQVEMSWQIPARPGMVPDEFLADNPWFEEVLQAVPVAESLAPEGVEEFTPQIQDIVTRHYQDLLFSQKSAADVADAIQDDLLALQED
ncbi:sugar ABC transporter substrate-binding protein [Phytoactinopolyspora alkaliphila]|uniref:Sugar ABC transporter substrate-binding protein n=1 Tax=Phytoactinopolyspora alkaliphila TaxID=1783498 RepID=A0A6N9YJS7_9ACTN|nr:sugar ABC transporter substrate-binding protein [Phytoactinopolyspora alkaliphila]NED95212.1 sugar ABC transporter substrate-binding protein [Phytoactinopolyspora alkaliphila]